MPLQSGIVKLNAVDFGAIVKNKDGFIPPSIYCGKAHATSADSLPVERVQTAPV